MLVNFSVANFRTFREKVELSMVASLYDKSHEEDNLIPNAFFGHRLLTSAVVYGANASGKSKLISAIKVMRDLVLTSSKDTQKGEPIPVIPFLLNTESKQQPTFFEVIFILKNEMFRYGFEATRTNIVSEWLYYRPKTKEIELFFREGQQISAHERKFPKGLALAKNHMIRENALMLSVAAQFNEGLAGKVLDWFTGLRVISGLEAIGYKGYSVTCLEDELKKERILHMLQQADLGISDIRRLEFDEKLLADKIPSAQFNQLKQKFNFESNKFFAVQTTHPVYDKEGQQIGIEAFDLEGDESSGTNQFFALAGPILDSIEKGYILIVDELDSKLHPNLVSKIVEIFNSKELNPKNAQLIFNTHDTNLLSADIFRRDQIWFVEKDRYGAGKLYSLSDFKEVRKEENFEDNYIRGKYGAIPVISEFENI
jgi:AAA15 family ATPase/GTPase